jgi:iduronate 2-sulfatase
MRRAIGAVACGLLLAATARAEHYEVFVVAGQSNADGRGAAVGLTGPLAKWARPQEDVRIAYSCSSLRGPVLTSGGFQPLRPGWSVAPGKARPTTLPSNTFGPEVSFGRGMADRLKGKQVRLIKFAEGGTSLAKELPAAEYERQLTAFIARVRADLGAPDMPFGIGEVIDNGKRDAVRAAQKATAEKVPGAFFVSAAGLTSHDGGTHFDAASQIELGDRFAAGMERALGRR